jgi:hypothetical protein
MGIQIWLENVNEGNQFRDQMEDNIKLDVAEVAAFNNVHLDNSNVNISFAIRIGNPNSISISESLLRFGCKVSGGVR